MPTLSATGIAVLRPASLIRILLTTFFILILLLVVLCHG
jgi:hypothetical protein